MAIRLVDSSFVEAMPNGWVVMIDEANTACDVARVDSEAAIAEVLLVRVAERYGFSDSPFVFG
jgi:hypothetical protein